MTHSVQQEVREALQKERSAFIGLGVFSALINLLMLTGPLFMLQVYDRVLASGSLPTLFALLILVTVLYAFLGVLDMLRSRILTRVAGTIDASLGERCFSAWVRQGLIGNAVERIRPLVDLATLRQFLSGPALPAFMDVPWAPVYLLVIFMFHWVLGIVALFGVLVIAGLAVLNARLTHRAMAEGARWQARESAFSSFGFRNAEAIVAMGMSGSVFDQRKRLHTKAGQFLTAAGDQSGAITSTTKALRLFLQSLILGTGAVLAVQQIITPGVMIAGSIIFGRAMAPVEQSIAQWRQFGAARRAYHQLNKVLAMFPAPKPRTELPAPTGHLTVDGVFAVPPGGQKSVLEGITFALSPGDGLGIIGPSASGKSSLARVLTGVWLPSRGKMRLDGATLDQWDQEAIGRHIGYLPQDVELFDGSVRENIARFDANAADEAVIAAAQLAHVHTMILGLPDGYETNIGDGGTLLSGGQRQRIALARAVFGGPALVVLDEPNANLDAAGDHALTLTIEALRAAGKTVIVIAHRASSLVAIDTVLMLRDGYQVAFGPKEEVLEQVTVPKPTLVRS